MEILLIVFIVLKITNIITWPWAIVLIPLWVVLGFFIVGCIMSLIIHLKNGDFDEF